MSSRRDNYDAVKRSIEHTYYMYRFYRRPEDIINQHITLMIENNIPITKG